jgi:hypothetical protein
LYRAEHRLWPGSWGPDWALPAIIAPSGTLRRATRAPAVRENPSTRALPDGIIDGTRNCPLKFFYFFSVRYLTFTASVGVTSQETYRLGRLVTSAGVTVGVDLALALVAEDHGTAIYRWHAPSVLSSWHSARAGNRNSVPCCCRPLIPPRRWASCRPMSWRIGGSLFPSSGWRPSGEPACGASRACLRGAGHHPARFRGERSPRPCAQSSRSDRLGPQGGRLRLRLCQPGTDARRLPAPPWAEPRCAIAKASHQAGPSLREGSVLVDRNARLQYREGGC